MALLVELQRHPRLLLLKVVRAFVLEELGLRQAFLLVELPALHFLFELVERDGVLDGGVRRNLQLLVAIRAERVPRLDDQPGSFTLAHLLQRHFHAGGDAELLALTDVELHVALFNHSPFVPSHDVTFDERAVVRRFLLLALGDDEPLDAAVAVLRQVLTLPAEHLKLELQRGVGWNVGRTAGNAVRVVCCTRQHTLLALPHGANADVEGSDDLALAQAELERLVAVEAAVEFRAVHQRSGVVETDRAAIAWRL